MTTILQMCKEEAFTCARSQNSGSPRGTGLPGLRSSRPCDLDPKGPRPPEPKPSPSPLLLCLYVCLSVSAFLSFLSSLLELDPSFSLSLCLGFCLLFSFSVSPSSLLVLLHLCHRPAGHLVQEGNEQTPREAGLLLAWVPSSKAGSQSQRLPAGGYRALGWGT